MSIRQTPKITLCCCCRQCCSFTTEPTQKKRSDLRPLKVGPTDPTCSLTSCSNACQSADLLWRENQPRAPNPLTLSHSQPLLRLAACCEPCVHSPSSSVLLFAVSSLKRFINLSAAGALRARGQCVFCVCFSGGKVADNTHSEVK